MDHVFIGRRCVHCDTDDHSLPEPGDTLAAWQKPCPVTGEDRQTVWSFDSADTRPRDWWGNPE